MEPKFIKTDRIEVVDALRGFAVLAILLLHHVEHFIFSVYPSDSPAWLSVIDKGVFNGMFALLFGVLVFVVQLKFCKWWLSKHKYGPLEAMWRRWTWNIF